MYAIITGVYHYNACHVETVIMPKVIEKALGETNQASLCHTIWYVLTLSEL